MVYKDKVLDVEKFRHPGPQQLITDNIGKDITQLFEENSHSNYALTLIEPLIVGHIKSIKLLENPYAKITVRE